MKLDESIKAFSALAHETRLTAFKMLVAAGNEGLAAGHISDCLGMPHNTLSFHLSLLCDSKLVTQHKKGRCMIYTVNFEITKALIFYMVENCCANDSTSVHTDNNGKTTIELFQECC